MKLILGFYNCVPSSLHKELQELGYSLKIGATEEMGALLYESDFEARDKDELNERIYEVVDREIPFGAFIFRKTDTWL